MDMPTPPCVLRLSCALLIGSMLVACSSDDSSSASDRTAPSGTVRQAQSNAELEAYLKEGLRQANQINSPTPVLDARLDDFTAAPTAEATSENYSTTNVVERGVDEADFIKYDGEYLYAIQQNWGYICVEPLLDSDEFGFAPEILPPEHDDLVIYQTLTDPARVETVAQYSLPYPGAGNNGYSDYFDIDGIYLYEADSSEAKSLLVVSRGYQSIYRPLREDWAYPYVWTRGHTAIHDIDVTDPAQPDSAHTIHIDGYLVDSRRVGNTLYLVTRFTPYIANLIAYPTNEDQQQANNAVIDSLDIETLLPNITIDGVSSKLLSSNDCYLETAIDGYPTLMTVTAIDLANGLQHASKCLAADTYNMYMAPESLYLTATQWRAEATQIYKFSLNNNGVQYRGAGKVPGSIAWQSQAFALSEHDGLLRIITSIFASGSNQFEHRLHILEEQSGKLQVIGTLPNEANPQAIGKPGEAIYAIRYVNDLAYVVTFRRIDPLYVLDLSNPRNPAFAGELEVPGFSDYLHPLDGGLLLGIGRDVDPDTNRLGGLKLELFDVSDPQNPQSVRSEVLGNYGYSDALYDHHAVTFLAGTDDRLSRIAIPATIYESNATLETFQEGLFMFDVGYGLDGKPQLLGGDPIITRDEHSDPYYYGNYRRAVIVNDDVHYLIGWQVWSAQWGDGGAAIGPQGATPKE